MPFQPGSANYTQSFGTNPENIEVPHIDVRAPTTTDIIYPVGKVWVDTVGNASYTLTSLVTSGNVTTATWVTTGGGSGAVSTLSGDTGTASPSGGNIQIAGTAGQINTTGAGSTIILDFPNTVTFPGAIVALGTIQGASNIVATAGFLTSTGNITSNNGNLVLGTAGNKVFIGTGANASVGTATLAAGTVVVNTTAVTAGSLIFLSRASVGATGAAGTGTLTIGLITDGVSFTIVSLDPTNATTFQTTDLSVVNWWIIN